jgi:hypothetical protein
MKLTNKPDFTDFTPLIAYGDNLWWSNPDIPSLIEFGDSYSLTKVYRFWFDDPETERTALAGIFKSSYVDAVGLNNLTEEDIHNLFVSAQVMFLEDVFITGGIQFCLTEAYEKVNKLINFNSDYKFYISPDCVLDTPKQGETDYTFST